MERIKFADVFLMFFPSFSSFLGLSKVMKLISVAGLTWSANISLHFLF